MLDVQKVVWTGWSGYPLAVMTTRSPAVLIREVCRKSKWKFKMAFAMKGGRGLECHIPILKNDFC